MGPRTLLLLLSEVLVLTKTWAGECGVGRERPLLEGTRFLPRPGGYGSWVPLLRISKPNMVTQTSFS